MKTLDLINKRIEKLKARIKPEMTNEELQAINDEIKELKESKAEVEALNTSISKYKEKLIDIVMTSGTPSNEPLADRTDPGTNEPKSLEDVIKEACDAKDNQGGK